MEYRIDLENVKRGMVDQHYKAKVVYTFTISNGFAKTRADVVLTEAGVNIIEQKGKNPQTAAKIVLERVLKQGRDPFETQILLTVPYGHAEYFARFGNHETLLTLAD
jgi:antitoxin component of RelBE/YafQ-DinJ toxin-antitoxin module